MKTSNTMNLLAFSIMAITFSVSVTTTKAQVHPDLGGGFPRDICYCKAKNYGCGTNSVCYAHCSVGCRPRTVKMVKVDKINLSGIVGVFIKLTQPEYNSLNLFENKKSTLKLRNNSPSQSIRKLEWEALDIDALN